MEEAKSTRVMGVGVGVFLLSFFGATSLLMCLVGSTTARPGLFYVTSTIIYGVLLIVLFTAEKEPRYIVDEGDIVEGYDSHYYTRLSTFIVLLFCTLFSLWSVCKLALVQQLYAKPMYELGDRKRAKPIF